MEIDKLEIEWNTGEKSKEYDLLKEEYLNRIGVEDSSDIKKVTPFFAFPEEPYTEEGVASTHHPCIGSGGAIVETNEGKRGKIEEIFYYDYGHESGEYKGVPHYNKEGRFTDVNGEVTTTRNVDDHVIEEPTDHLEITLQTPSGNKSQNISGWDNK